MPLMDEHCGVVVDWSALDLDTFVKINELRNYISEHNEREMKKMKQR